MFSTYNIIQKTISLSVAGLDPASPLFRQMLSASLLSLSADDAAFVDVVHTDGARIWSEGFGLFNPIGDVDYFPNGGLDQPGCEQVRGSVIVSRFGKSYKIYRLHILFRSNNTIPVLLRPNLNRIIFMYILMHNTYMKYYLFKQ